MNLSAHLTPSEPLHEAADAAFRAGVQEAWHAAGIMCAVILLIAAVWIILSKIQPPKKKLSAAKQIILARWIAIVTVIAVASVSWDTWWHRAVGRDTLWEAPHLLLYGAAVFCILASVYGWYATRDSKWKKLASVLLLIPIGAPFDQLWHTFFGVEDLTRPVALIWAPPHLLIAFASAFTLIFLLPILYHDTKQGIRNFMGMIIFGTLTATGLFLLLPAHPTEGLGQVIGFWGALPMSMAIVTGPLIGRAWMKDDTGATKIMFVSITLLLIAYTQEKAPHVIMLPHDTMPNWLIVSTNLIAAAWLDWSYRISIPVRGCIAGLVSATCMFGIARYFFDPAFFYGTEKLLIAIVSGGVGGTLGAVIAERAMTVLRLKNSQSTDAILGSAKPYIDNFHE